MKTLLVLGIIVLGMFGQVAAMGHPHNLFAARRQLQARMVYAPHSKAASAKWTNWPLDVPGRTVCRFGWWPKL